MPRMLPHAALFVLVIIVVVSRTATEAASEQNRRPNLMVILADDHRFDALGCAGHPFLKTPNIDRLAREGAMFTRAVVTTSLCSPSRASILTGLYAHRHGVIDNYHPVRGDLAFFPQRLQQAGYETAFIGKWHMGDTDDPQRGFDHWVAFRGQGEYFPDGRGTRRVVPQSSRDGFNINGQRVPQRGYMTDELTDHALDWLRDRGRMKGDRAAAPFLLYLSHKAVHSDFVPADRHRGQYADQPVTFPAIPPETNRPRWLVDQRNSRHGVGFAYNLAAHDLADTYRRYCETILALDESTGRLIAELAAAGEDRDTLVVYLGDNGFQFGEQGLIDKRTAYEASLRIPLLVRWPARIPAGKVVSQTVANIDLPPTLLAAAGAAPLGGIDGRDFLPLLTAGQPPPWRTTLLYEYFWEWNYPHTPTMHALLDDADGGRWKYIRYHGIWDTDELFDLRADPGETTNLIDRTDQRERVLGMRRALFELLAESDGGAIPLLPDRGTAYPWRRPDGPAPGVFPARFHVPEEPPGE